MTSEASSQALPTGPLSAQSEDREDSYKYPPPGNHFRVVKCLSNHSDGVVYLCLPRKLPAPFEPKTEVDYEHRDKYMEQYLEYKGYLADREIPNQRLFQQTWLLEFPRLADTLLHCMTNNGVSLLKQEHQKRLPQLVVVKLGKKINAESKHIERILRGKFASLHVGSFIKSSAICSDPEESFLCLRPIFGPTLRQFVETFTTTVMVPTWFVAHIAISLVAALDFVHGEGLVHDKLTFDTVMINLYPTEVHYRYHGYPDIQLINFSEAKPVDDAGIFKDAQGLTRIVEELVRRWSDKTTYIDIRTAAGEQLGALDRSMSHYLNDLLQFWQEHETYTVDNVKNRFGTRAKALRRCGPAIFPRNLLKFSHSDLVTETELERALRGPLVLKFKSKREDLKRIVLDEPVAMGSGGHAGMKTSYILLIRFMDRKMDFVKAVRPDLATETSQEHEAGDVEMVDGTGSDVDAEGDSESNYWAFDD